MIEPGTMARGTTAFQARAYFRRNGRKTRSLSPAPRDSASPTPNLDVLGELAPKAVRFDSEIVGCLKIQPETRGITEKSSEPQRGIGADRALTMDDLVDTSSRNTQAFGEAVLSERQGLEKFFIQDLAGMNGG
ncbi:MAG TPA: hypothetical protein VGM29_17865 [Polyangiaceae bacterium]|jgi:hypothetical protein